MPSGYTLNLTRLGWGLAIPVLFLAGVGLATIWVTDRGPDAATSLFALDPVQPPSGWWDRVVEFLGSLTLRQIVFLLTGAGLMLATLLVSYQRIGRFAFLIYWVCIALLAALALDRYTDVPLVPVVRNTRRWIELFGVRLQPSEFVKLGLVLALARYLRFRESYRTWRGLVPPFLFTLLPMALIMFQPDLGTVLMLLPVLFAMLFVAGARLRHLALIVAAAMVLAPAFYVWGMEPYQKVRIDVVFKQNSPDEQWHKGPGYQLRQSKIALGTGGVWGEGFGQGVFVEHDLLPEEHNDFIFAMIGHQWGFVGGLLVIVAYAVIVLCGIEVATVTNDPFGRLIAVGVVMMIVSQALLNMGMTIGFFPITGMTLPFVSAGGSSLWANFVALGLLVNVAQRRPMLIARKPFVFTE